jgi:hypothetical protein
VASLQAILTAILKSLLADSRSSFEIIQYCITFAVETVLLNDLRTLLKMGRYTPVYHTELPFSSWISHQHFSIYSVSVYIFPFFWLYILVLFWRSIPTLLNFHFEHCLRVITIIAFAWKIWRKPREPQPRWLLLYPELTQAYLNSLFNSHTSMDIFSSSFCWLR